MGTGLTVVVLAAGEGKRMRSRRPKVLHRLGGRPLIAYPVSLARRPRGPALPGGGAGGGVEEPAGYGRVIREGGSVTAIVEDRDASPQQREIREIGTSVYCFDARRLWAALDRGRTDNDQGEYSLPAVIGVLQRQGQPVVAVVTDDPTECLGINDRKQLARVAGLLRQRTLDRLLAEGGA